jgi:hypothetical protein
MQGAAWLVTSGGGAIGIFAASVYVALFYYYLRREFLDQLLNELANYFSVWGNKVQNVSYTTLTASFYLLYIVAATIVNRSSSSIALILTVDLVRMGYLGLHLARGRKQVNFPTSVALKNVALSLLCSLLLFLCLLYPNKTEPAVFLLILFPIYLVLVVAHETIVEYVLGFFNRPNYEQRRSSEEIYLASCGQDVQSELEDFSKLMEKMNVPDPEVNLTLAKLFFSVRLYLQRKGQELTVLRDKNFEEYVLKAEDMEENQADMYPHP